MSSFILKIIAIISMTCDHFSYVIYKKFTNLNYIGRLAFPIFAFQISEGYEHTKNLKKYFLRLFMFAIISQIPFMLFKSRVTTGFSLNVFFTLLLGLLAITIYDIFYKLESDNKAMHFFNNIFSIVCVICIACISEALKCDYGYYGVAIIFLFHIFRQKKLLMNIGFIICTIIFYLKNILYSPYYSTYLYIIAFTCFSLFFINLYNNKKGKDLKYIFYLFYPIHLLLLYALSFIYSA